MKNLFYLYFLSLFLQSNQRPKRISDLLYHYVYQFEKEGLMS